MKETTEILKNLHLVSQLGLMMVGCVCAGLGIGYYLDMKLSHFPAWSLTFLFIGIFSGFWSVYKMIMRTLK